MKIKIGLIFGGKSVEHEVSIISAHQVIEAIDYQKYEVVPIYISKSNKWYTGKQLLDIENFKDIEKLINNVKEVKLISNNNKYYLYEFPFKRIFNKTIEIDLAFPVVHGTNVEDGTLQGFLETINIPFVGSNVISSSIAQDKVIMKMIWEKNNLPVVPYKWITKNKLINEKKIDEKIKDIQFPIIIKPANLGSSIGIEIAHNKEEFYKYLNNCFKYDDKVIIEKLLKGYEEINCSVLGDIEETKVSVLEKVNEFNDKGYLSYDDKYRPKGVKSNNNNGMLNTVREVPANISSQEEVNKIKEISKKAFKSLGMSGVCRIDCFYNGKDIYLNEINSIPGSLSYYLWEETNISFKELINILIDLAIKKFKEKENKISSYNTNLLDENNVGKLSKFNNKI